MIILQLPYFASFCRHDQTCSLLQNVFSFLCKFTFFMFFVWPSRSTFGSLVYLNADELQSSEIKKHQKDPCRRGKSYDIHLCYEIFIYLWLQNIDIIIVSTTQLTRYSLFRDYDLLSLPVSLHYYQHYQARVLKLKEQR